MSTCNLFHSLFYKVTFKYKDNAKVISDTIPYHIFVSDLT